MMQRFSSARLYVATSFCHNHKLGSSPGKTFALCSPHISLTFLMHARNSLQLSYYRQKLQMSIRRYRYLAQGYHKLLPIVGHNGLFLPNQIVAFDNCPVLVVQQFHLLVVRCISYPKALGIMQIPYGIDSIFMITFSFIPDTRITKQREYEEKEDF